MNKLIKLFLIFGVIFSSCTSNTILEKPKDLIPEAKMVNLLTDILIADGADNIKNINLQRNINYFPLVFEKYQIDTTRFLESNYYYTSKIDTYNEILEKVNLRLVSLKKQYENEIKTLDSIKNLKKDSIKKSKNRPFLKSDSSIVKKIRNRPSIRNQN
jgi:hypothetical protein